MVLCLKARESKSLPGLRNASFVSHLFIDLPYTVSLYDFLLNLVRSAVVLSVLDCDVLTIVHIYYLFYVCENNSIVILTSL